MKYEKIESSNKEISIVQQQHMNEIKVKELLTVEDACKLSGLSRTTIWRFIKTDQLKRPKVGRRVIIKRSHLNKLFN